MSYTVLLLCLLLSMTKLGKLT